MPAGQQKNLFTKYGKKLRHYHNYDSLNTLAGISAQDSSDLTQETITFISAPEIHQRETATSIYASFRFSPKLIIQTIKLEYRAMRESKVFVIPTISFVSNLALAGIVLFVLLSGLGKGTPSNIKRYSIFSAKPLTLGAYSERLSGGDTRAVVLDKVFESYNCPLTGTGKIFVEEADKNNIPYWFAAAISFQESNCGKKTPVINGAESHNAWGWAVWGDNTHGFSSWEDGIETVSKYLSDKFFSKGITDPCEIMKTYTPPSKGSWCEGVKYFGEIITGYQTP